MKLVILTFLFSYSSWINGQSYINEDGVFFEQPRFYEGERYKFTTDNISYKLHKSFTYKYYYMDNHGKKYKFLFHRNSKKADNELELIDYDSIGSNVIEKVRIDVDDYREAFSYKEYYPQTVISYYFENSFGKTSDTIYKVAKSKNPDLRFPDESTGVVDNNINIWLHPPRSHTFKILQLSPYPFIFLDDKKKKWDWKLETGGLYLDIRWIPQLSENSVVINYHYERGKDEIIESPIGKIKCKIVYSTGSFEVEARKYKSSLKSYYSYSLGFVRLEYINVNNSKIILQLVGTKDN